MSMLDMAKMQAKRSAVRAILGAIFTPIRWASYLAYGTVTIYTDGPRYSKSPGHRPRTSRQELQINAGAVLWAFVPSVARHFGAPTILVCALALVAVVLIGRRLLCADPQTQTQTRLTVPAFWQRHTLLIPMFVAFAVALLPIIPATRGLLADFVPPVWWLPGAAIALGGVFYWAALLVSARHAGRGRARASEVAAMLRVACGVTDQEVAESLRFKNGSWTLSPAPAIALAKLASDGAGVDAAVASIMPRYEIVLDGRDLVVREASLETADRRAQMAASEGLVIGQTRDGDVLTMILAAGVSPSSAERVQAYARTVLGAESALLVDWGPYESRAVARVLSQDEQQVRARLAAVLKLRFAWELEADVTSRDGHIDRVVLHRLPAGLGGVTPEERIEFWRSIARSLPSGSNGWTATEASDGVITLKWGPKRALESSIRGRELLPTAIDPQSWQSLIIGRTETGAEASVNLKAGPHSLVVGGTGSGKSVCLRMIILSALSRGYEYIGIDPSKKLAGLRDMDPYAKAITTTTKIAALETLQSIYAEVTRRVDLTEQYRVDGWRGIPKSEGIRPWIVVVDEFAGLVKAPLKPIDRKSQAYAEYEELAGAVDGIQNLIEKIAAEARSAGIHLVIATQTAYANLLGGELRLNLGTRIQMVPPKAGVAKSHLSMLFEGSEVDAAVDAIDALNDGRSPGFAVMAVEGAGVQGVRVGYIANERPDPETGEGRFIQDDLEYLRELGVPLGVPLAASADAGTLGRPEDTFGQIIESTTPATDLGDLDLGDLDLGDLDLGEFTTASPGELPPVPATAPVPAMFDTPGNTAPAPQPQQPPVIHSNRPNFDDLFG